MIVAPQQPKGNARGSGYDRAAADWYQEPKRAIDELLDVETFDGMIWDPACGGGNIPKACAARGIHSVASDIADRGYGKPGVDFLRGGFLPGARHIITNPPFNLGVQFTLHALSLVYGKVAILQRTAWLEGENRYHLLFAHGKLARVWQFRRRISMPPGGRDIPAKNGSTSYAWFVFDPSHVGDPALGWLP